MNVNRLAATGLAVGSAIFTGCGQEQPPTVVQVGVISEACRIDYRAIRQTPFWADTKADTTNPPLARAENIVVIARIGEKVYRGGRYPYSYLTYETNPKTGESVLVMKDDGEDNLWLEISRPDSGINHGFIAIGGKNCKVLDNKASTINLPPTPSQTYTPKSTEIPKKPIATAMPAIKQKKP